MGCPGSGTNCSGVCLNLNTDPNNCGACARRCTTGQYCYYGTCGTCSAPSRICNGLCANVQTDTSNCGACGIQCGSGYNCTAGRCVSR